MLMRPSRSPTPPVPANQFHADPSATPPISASIAGSGVNPRSLGRSPMRSPPQAVLETELMTPGYNPDSSNPLSAITLQSLADMGYTVDLSQAEPYQLPAQLAATMTESPRKTDDIDYGDGHSE